MHMHMSKLCDLSNLFVENGIQMENKNAIHADERCCRYGILYLFVAENGFGASVAKQACVRLLLMQGNIEILFNV